MLYTCRQNGNGRYRLTFEAPLLPFRGLFNWGGVMNRKIDDTLAIMILFIVAIVAATIVVVKFMDTYKTLEQTDRAVTIQL